jgi:hypothetical protein
VIGPPRRDETQEGQDTTLQVGSTVGVALFDSLEDEAVEQGGEASRHGVDVEIGRQLPGVDRFPPDERRDRHRALATPAVSR